MTKKVIKYDSIEMVFKPISGKMNLSVKLFFDKQKKYYIHEHWEYLHLNSARKINDMSSNDSLALIERRNTDNVDGVRRFAELKVDLFCGIDLKNNFSEIEKIFEFRAKIKTLKEQLEILENDVSYNPQAIDEKLMNSLDIHNAKVMKWSGESDATDDFF